MGGREQFECGPESVSQPAWSVTQSASQLVSHRKREKSTSMVNQPASKSVSQSVSPGRREK